MPPPGGGKRKRGDRSYSGDDLQRPSPYRPSNLSLAQQQSSNYGREYSDYRGRGGRRPSRGGRNPSYSGQHQTRPRDILNEPKDSSLQDPKETIKPKEDLPEAQPPAPPLSPPADTSAFNYEALTPEILEDWQSSGKERITESCVEAASREDVLTLEMMMHELILATLSAQIPIADSGGIIQRTFEASADVVAEMDDHLYPNNAQSAFLDTICVILETNSSTSFSRLAQLIQATSIDEALLRQELDATILEKLGLIRNTFARMGIRKQTNVLYRQANFNLMREESEGFAKLMTELFTTSGSEAPTGENAKATVERVKAMIGAFDLDVGRTLDVVLDVFGAVLVKQFRFFVKFLRASPWWPRDSDISADPNVFDIFAGLPMWALPNCSDWHLTDEQKDEVVHQSSLRDAKFWSRARQIGVQAFYELGQRVPGYERLNVEMNGDTQDIAGQWVKSTGVRPRIGNKDAAQLLGFKLRFYSSSNARDENDVLPDNLIYLAALLIKIGFISLTDLYPHIWRADEDMEELRQQKLKEKADRERAARPGAGTKNALLMAGALADDTLPIPTRLREGSTRAGTPSKEIEPEKSTTGKDAPAEPADQKVLLLKSLLAIGALPEALFILGKFPWLLELYPDMTEFFHRIIHHSLSQVYNELRPLSDRDSFQLPRPTAETDLPGISKGQVRLSEPPVRKTLRWALLDRVDSSDGSDYRFYWDEWNDNIPMCRTVDDVFTLCDTLVDLVGIKIGSDPAVLLKLSRIGKRSLLQDSSEANRQRWLDLSKRYLLPALSLTKSNAGVVNEVFGLISNFSTNTRYLMYLEWSSGRVSRIPDIKSATDQAKAETKDVLKRISKTNVKPMARALAKIAYANPHIVITTAIAQIEVYDSIADVFVEGARYFTDLGYDVLTWAMISSMSREGRSRTRQGGLFTSKWLSALANFAGKLFKRYSIMKPGPLLQYVDEKLGRGNSTDLIMLEQLISSMAGIASDINFNDAQLQAMGGGELLQQQTLMQVLDRRHDSRLSSRRLMRSLRDTGLTGSLLLSLAQQRQSCIYKDEYKSAPLKLLGMIFDDIHQVMTQYLELLKANLSNDEFTSSVPDVVDLLLKFGMPPEIAFWISRPILSRRMAEVERREASLKRLDDATGRDLPNGDVDIIDEINGDEEEGEEVENENVTDLAAAATPTPAEISGSAMEVDMDKTEDFAVNEPNREQQWHPILKDLMNSISYRMPSEVLEVIGMGFYVTFWQLSPYDITIPGKSYEDEVSRQNKKINSISIDTSDISVAGKKKREEMKAQLTSLVDRLLAENKQHLKTFGEIKSRLAREKDQWFAGKARIYEQLNSALMEFCFLPRLLFSPLDAYFCFKFIKFLHAAGTPNFRTLGFYDLIFKQDRLTSLVFVCSAKEADNFGRFLSEILRDLGRWHQNKSIYEKEAFGFKRNLPGFAMKLDPHGKPSTFLNYEEFRRILYKWHMNIYQAMTNCLSSSEYMHIRNAISVLRAISLHFPAVNWHGAKLVELLKKLGEDNTREDLQLASKAVMGALHRREKSWVIPQAFKKGQEKSETRAEDIKEEKSLNAQAAEFKPSHTAEPPKASTEDGELADTTMTEAPKVQPTTKRKEAPEKPEALEKTTAEASDPKSASQSEPKADEQTQAPSEASGDSNVSELKNAVSSTSGQPLHELPKRIQPASGSRPSSTRPPNLPHRPEAADTRSTSRENPRSIPRPQYNADTRLPVESRSGRQTRPDDRNLDSYDRPPYHGQERDHGRVREGHPLRSEREYPRQPDHTYERDRGHTTYNSRPSRSRPEEPRSERSAQIPTAGNTKVEPGPSGPPTTINPERAALIESLDSRPNLSIRGQAQEKNSKPPKPLSPSRSEDRRQLKHDREPDRPFRTESHNQNPVSRVERPDTDSRQRYPPIHGDMQHGRLEQDFSQSYDRREFDAPSGPRARGPSTRGVPSNLQPAERPPLPSGTERPPPSGPARPHTRSNSYAEPSTPASDASGVHPDRLKQILPSPSESRPPPRPPMPIQTSPPLGPRGNAPAGAPSGPSPTTRGPPSGPQNPNEMSVRGRRHPLTAVNNTLQQAQGPSSRGRGGRQTAPVNPHIGPPVNGHTSPSDGRELFGQQNGGTTRERPPSRREDEKRPIRQTSGRTTPEREGRGERGERDVRDSTRHDDSRRSIRREDEDRRRDDKRPKEDLSRKHSRGEDNYGRGGMRMASDSKRPRRGG